MEGLTEQEQKYFDSKGESEVTEEVEVTVEAPAEVKPEVIAEAPPKLEERKKPSKFTYSEDTDNVQDDLGRKYVPLGAIQEARNENKTLKKELDELKSKWTGGEQKLNTLLARLQPEKQEAPAYDKDPLAHLKAKNDALEAEMKAVKEAEQRRGKESETNNQLAEFQRNVVAAERAFAKTAPDYAEAVAKVQEIWRAELETAGVPENFIESTLARRGAQFSHAALQKEQNPAEAVYKLAQRYGYKKAEAEKKDEPNKDKEKLATIAKGQEAEKSLGSGKANADMSLEALATMSDEEIEAFVADPKKWKQFSKAA
jgi:hypothetical protein